MKNRHSKPPYEKRPKLRSNKWWIVVLFFIIFILINFNVFAINTNNISNLTQSAGNSAINIGNEFSNVIQTQVTNTEKILSTVTGDPNSNAQESIIPSKISISPTYQPTISTNKPPEPQIKDPTIIPTTIPKLDFKQSPKTTSYPYVVDGNRKSISFTTYGGLSDYFSKKGHSYHYDPEKEVVMPLLENEYQDDNVRPLIELIRKSSTNPDEQSKIAISLVQHIPYNWNKYYGTSMDWFYPYETLYNNKGVCADKSLLLAYLLNELGYDTVLFEFSGHMAVGVKCSSNYGFYDTGYAFIETTRPTIITYVPDTYMSGFKVSSNPHIIHLNGGKKVLDVSTEYRDAIKMKQLQAMGEVLDQSHYAEWLRLSNNYDLQYDT